MNDPIQGRIPRETLLEWLDGGTPLLQAVKPGRGETCYTFVKIPQQENIDFIFGQENYYSPRVGWHDKFEFCGAYSHQTKLLRLTDTPLTHIADGLTPEENMDFEELLRQVNVQINACVEEIVGNDRANLPVQVVTDEAIQRSLQQYREYEAKEEAIRAFIAASGSAPQFRGWYHAEQWTETGIAAYLTGPDGYIRAQAEDYIAQNGEDLLAQFLKHDALAEEIQKIEADADSPLHRMKAITQALNQCGAKSVNVTIQKNDVEMTFKVPANGLNGYRISYNTWDIPAADRREFYEAFGRSADYTAEDITKITYGRNTIYEAPPAPAEEMTEDIGMGGMSL